jgi:hypothetical protein
MCVSLQEEVEYLEDDEVDVEEGEDGGYDLEDIAEGEEEGDDDGVSEDGDEGEEEEGGELPGSASEDEEEDGSDEDVHRGVGRGKRGAAAAGGVAGGKRGVAAALGAAAAAAVSGKRALVTAPPQRGSRGMQGPKQQPGLAAGSKGGRKRGRGPVELEYEIEREDVVRQRM